MSDLTERNYYRESPALVNSKYSLSKQESDIVMMLLTTIHKDDEDFKDYTFTKSELEARIGSQINTTDLKNQAKGLMSKPLEVPTEKGFKLFSWFSYFEYEDGVITCTFDKRLKPYLLELGQFILADSRHLLRIKSNYVRRIYMMLKERYKFGSRSFDVQELMDLLQVPKSYRRYDNFKAKILKHAETEINKYTDLKVKLKEKKIGRKVVSVTFEIRKNDADLNTFKGYIRELYVNQVLFHSRDGHPIKCGEDGLLYDVETQRTFKAEEAHKIWEWMHEHREQLECFRKSLFDE